MWEDEVSARRALIGLGQRPLATAVESESGTTAEEMDEGENGGAQSETRKEGETGEMEQTGKYAYIIILGLDNVYRGGGIHNSAVSLRGALL